MRREYDALEEEFALIAEVAKARARAGLSQAELARRMKTTQSTIARLESGRGRPSTRTLDRFAKATGHRLKISFEPVKARGRPRSRIDRSPSTHLWFGFFCFLELRGRSSTFFAV